MLSAVFIVFLCSCSIDGFHSRLWDNSTEIATKRVEQLLEALKSKDGDAIKLMFSKRALIEAENLDENIEYLFELFQGEVLAKDECYPSEYGYNRYGQKMKKLTWWIRVETDVDKYIFFLVDYPRDDMQPDNVGLYTLRVIREEDEETLFTSFDIMEIPGVFRPESE